MKYRLLDMSKEVVYIDSQQLWLPGHGQANENSNMAWEGAVSS